MIWESVDDWLHEKRLPSDQDPEIEKECRREFYGNVNDSSKCIKLISLFVNEVYKQVPMAIVDQYMISCDDVNHECNKD